MDFRQRPTSPETDVSVVADSPLAVMLVCVVGGTVIAGLGELVWEWAATHTWLPRTGPVKLLALLPGPWSTVVAAAAGAAAGFVVGAVACHEALSVTVSDDRVILTSEDERQEFVSGEIGQVLLADGKLILLDRDGQELARRDCDLNRRRLVDAFDRHGYPSARRAPDGTT
ncbi:hypothetical protein ACIBI3_36195 [Actinomadura luteofluorescens]|uniref:YqeB family protein n=1 Tax=Actinomadura luteofluorescens TaxID=46163 RepID=UPI00347BC8C7